MDAGTHVGKTTGGHKITFKLYKGGTRIRDLVTATPTQCLPIQGGGSPMSGMDLWNPAISFPVNQADLEWGVLTGTPSAQIIGLDKMIVGARPFTLQQPLLNPTRG